MRWLSLFLTLCVVVHPLLALAEGEDDLLWQRSTYEKKVFEVGQRLLQANNIQENIAFRVDHSQQPESVNAYAIRFGGNTVTVGKGLLNYISSDDQLAAILGHEVAHIIRRHQRKSNVKRSLIAVGLATLIVAANGDNQDGIDRDVKSAKNLKPFLNPLEKKYETEADLVGIDLMVKAGYNPLAMESDMLALTGDQSWFFSHALSTHPSGVDRINAIRHHIAKHYPQFLTPELANDWSSPNPTLSASTFYHPPKLSVSAEKKDASMPTASADATATSDSALLKQLAESGAITPPDQTTVATHNTSPKPEAVTQPTPTKTPQAPSVAAVSTTSKSAEHPSLAKLLLALKPDHLAVLKALSKKGYLPEDQLKADYLQELPVEYREVMLMDLAQKKLIRIVGTEPDRIFILSDWVSEELEASSP